MRAESIDRCVVNHQQTDAISLVNQSNKIHNIEKKKIGPRTDPCGALHSLLPSGTRLSAANMLQLVLNV